MTGRPQPLMCVGGPAHGSWFACSYPNLIVCIPEDGEFEWTVSALPAASMPETVRYERRKLLWPGWRFPLAVWAYPNVDLVPVQPDACPNPLIEPVCRCDQYRDVLGRPRTGVPSSACHLDHCPLHGRGKVTPEGWFYRGMAARWRARWRGEYTTHDRFRWDRHPPRRADSDSEDRRAARFELPAPG